MENETTINQRIVKLIELLNYSQRAFAKELGTSVARINHIVNGRNSPDIAFITLLLQAFPDVNISWLIEGKGSVFTTVNTKALPGHHLFVPASAMAGYAIAFSDGIPEMEYIRIPGVPSDAVTFEVVGDSMLPILVDGDYITCLKVLDTSTIDPKAVYVVVSSEGIAVKYIQIEGYNLMLTSSNQVYSPYVVSMSNVKEIWKVVLRTTKAVFKQPLEDDRLAKLERFIAKNFPDFNQS